MYEISENDRKQLTRVLKLVQDVLGSEAIATYLFGSAVLGGLKPESDLDILLVLKRGTTQEEKQRLVDGLLPISGRVTANGRWRSLELTIVVEKEVNPWHYPPRMDFQYGDWLRDEFEKGKFEPSKENPDLAMLITMVMLGGTPLYGPPPSAIFEPVPTGDLMRAMIDGLDDIREYLPFDIRNMILTLARIWSTVETGTIRSKDAAAEWALERLPAEHREVLARAKAIYLGEQIDYWEDLRDQLEAFADLVVDEIRLSFYERTKRDAPTLPSPKCEVHEFGGGG